ncbi:MAG: hypothetical protein ABMA64_15910 [Myxococcota bacterium]
MRIVGWVCAIAAGCSAGPVDLTTISDLRLVAAVAEPPEVAAGETYQLDVVLVDPQGRDVDVVVASCLPEGIEPPEGVDPCLVATPELVGDTASVELLAVLPAPVFVVACVDGSCRDPSEAQLRDPYGWLQELPLEGVAAGSRMTRITELPPEERHQNPVIGDAPPPELDPVAPEAVVPLAWVVPGAETASGLTTAGAFGAVSVDVAEDGAVALDWYAPIEAGPAQLYVVVDDGLGGTAVWRGSASTR